MSGFSASVVVVRVNSRGVDETIGGELSGWSDINMDKQTSVAILVFICVKTGHAPLERRF